jgi:uncharacterized membrane protein YuzA (DUF378 family)
MTPGTAHATTSASAAYGTRDGLSAMDWIAMILLIIGGLNWGLVGAFDFDLVAAIFGPMTLLSRLIYVLVGLAALYAIYMTVRLGRR